MEPRLPRGPLLPQEAPQKEEGKTTRQDQVPSPKEEVHYAHLPSTACVVGRGCNSRLGVSLETHVKIWYQKLKLKLSYEQLKTEKPIK